MFAGITLEVANSRDITNKSVFIKNLRHEQDDGNRVRLYWDWPPFQSNVNYAYIFITEDADETLEGLLARGARCEIAPRSGENPDGSNFSFTLEDNVGLRVYPAIYVDNYVKVFEQTEGNRAGPLYKRTIIRRQIKYKGFGKNTSVSFLFENPRLLKDIPEDSLMYCLYDKKTGAEEAVYPLDLSLVTSGSYSLVINRRYKADLRCNDKYCGAVVIKDF